MTYFGQKSRKTQKWPIKHTTGLDEGLVIGINVGDALLIEFDYALRVDVDNNLGRDDGYALGTEVGEAHMIELGDALGFDVGVAVVTNNVDIHWLTEGDALGICVVDHLDRWGSWHKQIWDQT